MNSKRTRGARKELQKNSRSSERTQKELEELEMNSKITRSETLYAEEYGVVRFLLLHTKRFLTVVFLKFMPLRRDFSV